MKPSERRALKYSGLGLVAVLIATLVASLASRGLDELRIARAEAEQLRIERHALEGSIDALESELAAMSTESGREARARRDLGMVRPDETVILLDPQDLTEDSDSSLTVTDPNPILTLPDRHRAGHP